MNSPPYLVYRYTAPICPKPALCFLDEKKRRLDSILQKLSCHVVVFYLLLHLGCPTFSSLRPARPRSKLLHFHHHHHQHCLLLSRNKES